MSATLRIAMAQFDFPVGDLAGNTQRIIEQIAQALHAAQLGFAHPVTGNWLDFDSPMPQDMAALLQTLRAGTPGG